MHDLARNRAKVQTKNVQVCQDMPRPRLFDDCDGVAVAWSTRYRLHSPRALSNSHLKKILVGKSWEAPFPCHFHATCTATYTMMKLHFFHQLVALIALTALRIRIHRGANFGHRKGPGIGVQSPRAVSKLRRLVWNNDELISMLYEWFKWLNAVRYNIRIGS